MANRIIADNDAFERICSDCRWCLRRNVCTALKRHVNAGGPLSIHDPVQAAQELRETQDKIAGLYAVKDDLVDFLLDYMKENELTEIEGLDSVASVSVSKKRSIDPERARAVMGDDLFNKYGASSITMKSIGDLLKGDELSVDQKTLLKGLVQTNYGEPSIKTKKKSPLV